MMKLAIILLAGVNGLTPIHEPIDKLVLADRIAIAFADLTSLSFEATTRVVAHSPFPGPKPPGKMRYTVRMGDGGRSRVEAFHDEKPCWALICDGVKTTEWTAEPNEWSEYPVASDSKGQPQRFRQVLLAAKNGPAMSARMLNRYGDSWIGKENPEQARLQALVRSDLTKCVLGRSIGGKECHAIKMTDKYMHPDGALYGKGGEELRMYFDAHTLLPVREIQTFGGGPLGFSLMGGRVDTDYLNVIPNALLAKSDFEFTPPPGSKFVSPDDPRFAPPPELVGKPAPRFAIANVDGTPCDLASFKNKQPVLLVFWATWCGPCSQEIPFLRELRSEHSTDALAILAVSSEAKAADLARFAKKKKMTYSILHDEKKEVSKAYQASAIPRTFLIDKDGKIVKVWKGWSGDEEAKEIRAEIAKLMK